MTDDAGRPERGRRTTVIHSASPGPSGPASAPPPPSGGYVSSTARPDRRRLILFGVAAAVLLGVVFALLMRPDLDRNRETTVAQRGAAQEGGREQLSFDVKPAREPYRAPDRDAISQAYSQAAKVFATEGVSGLARYGLECFRTLERRTTYRQLDYCLAFDAFGAAINQRVSGGQPPPPESYFGQSSSRHLSVAEAAVGGEGDANARLTDIRRIAIEVARLSGPAVGANAAATGAVAPPGTAVASAGSLSPLPAGSVPAASVPAQAQVPTQAQAQAQVQAQAPQARIPAPDPAPAAVRVEARAPVAAPPRGAPTAQEVAAARPARGSGPSFNCRYARTAAERMVCSEPELADADRRLNAAYEDAIASGADRASLRLEQDRWLAVREGAAPDPNAVRDVYERRIQELRSGR